MDGELPVAPEGCGKKKSKFHPGSIKNKISPHSKCSIDLLLIARILLGVLGRPQFIARVGSNVVVFVRAVKKSG